MLSDFPCHATIPVKDFDRAKTFYGKTLGFTTKDEQPAGILYDAGKGTYFLVYASAGPTNGAHTSIGFSVDDIKAQVTELKSNGVTFEEYDLPGLKTVDSIAEVGPGRAAWFKDPEGNIIGLIDFK